MRRLCVALCSALALAACSAGPGQATGESETANSDVPRPLAIMTSLPILWDEGDIGDMLAGETAPNPVRETLKARFAIKPLDRMTQLSPEQHLLLLAQPRAFAGDENVALDDWVRAGGRVLLFVDPMLTMHSRYPLGDSRAPVFAAMNSPILGRWGLGLTFDPVSSPVEAVEDGDPPIPVRRPGKLVEADGFESSCKISHNGLVADCRVGAGHALIVADAAVVETGDHAGEGSIPALSALLTQAFPPE